ncbi:MAG: hypothetical protein PHW43_11490, partial [Syntrophales bacterium]|nr:hypothetical protein [Syntrophales bacterium]
LLAIYLASLLEFWGLLFPDRSLSSVLDSIRRVEEKVDVQTEEAIERFGQIISMDCREVAEHSWDIDRGLIIIGEDSISLETEEGKARFRKPTSDLFMFDFVFRPIIPELFNIVVSFKDGKNREISLDIDTTSRHRPALHWIYKENGTLSNEERRFFTAIQEGSEIKLRIETVQNPEGLDARAFFFFTPIGKQEQLPIYLKDLSVDRFYNKEVFLHLGINNFAQKVEGEIMLKIIQCSITPKQEFHL